jgi:hypothetical protein
VITTYLLSLAVFIPVSGWIADRLGTRAVFCAAIAIFATGSVLCGLSTSLPMMLVMCVLQGFGGDMRTQVGRLILLRSFPRPAPSVSEYLDRVISPTTHCDILFSGETTMRSRIIHATALISALAMVPRPVPAATTQDSFLLRTAGDLVAVCSPASDDPLMAAAVGVCEGFTVGVFRTLEEIQAGFRAKLFCMPTPGPARSQAIASFVAWAQANPDVVSGAPADAILRYLQQTYPCAGGRP